MVEERTKHTILIVEDDSPTLDVLVDKLTLEGFNTLQARDGEEGLLIANRDHPDILLLDIIMPKMNGLEVMKRLRAESTWGKNVPVILLTNVSPDEEKTKRSVSESEPAYYLIKTDWSISDVIKKVREILNKS